MLRGRATSTTYLYEDAEHPDRITGTVTSPAWTREDRDALLGLEQYEGTLCPGCGNPRQLAWHAHLEDDWESDLLVCAACTSKNPGPERAQQVYAITTLHATAADIAALDPLEIGANTLKPTNPS